MKVVKKATATYEARPYTNELVAEEVAKWCGAVQVNDTCVVTTSGGTVVANYGDWIVQIDNGVDYEVYSDDAFIKTFERLHD